MTTSLECTDTATNTLEMARMLKVYKVEGTNTSKPLHSGGTAASAVNIDPAELEKVG